MRHLHERAEFCGARGLNYNEMVPCLLCTSLILLTYLPLLVEGLHKIRDGKELREEVGVGREDNGEEKASWEQDGQTDSGQHRVK